MSSSQAPADSDREYRLIEQLELRIASANTDTKFETVVQKFLAALVLKVGSENVRNRNLAIKVCQHVNQRIKLDNSISLPIQPLLKTFRESQSAFVSRFALMFLEQGLTRLPQGQRSTILPEVLRGSIPENKEYHAVQGKMWSVAFDFLLEVLRTWRVPDHTTKEETELKGIFNLSQGQSKYLSGILADFISYDLKTKALWKPMSEDFAPIFEKHAKSRSQVIVPIAKFLFTSIFTDGERLASAILLSVDPNDAASGTADVMFKQCNFDFEKDDSVDLLFDLFDINRPKLQIKILSLLGRSRNSTSRASKILTIIEQQLFRDGSGLEATKLRSAVFQYLTWAVRFSENLATIKDRLQTTLKEYIELQGWPTLSQVSLSQADVRAKAYESIGLVAAIPSNDEILEPMVSLDLITWLFTSLRCDTTKDVRHSIDEALSRVLNVTNIAAGTDLDKLKQLLLWNVQAQEGDQDNVYYFATVYSTRYIAIRFTNKVLPFDDVDARYIDVVALGFNDRREVAEESTRGLDPYWHITNARLSTDVPSHSTFSCPSFSKFIACVFDESNVKTIQNKSPSLVAAVTFGRNLLVYEGLDHSGFDVEPNTDWQQKLDALTGNDASARSALRQYMTHVDTVALIRLIENSILGLSLGSSTCADVALELVSMSSNRILESLGPEILSLLHKGCLNTAVQRQATKLFGIVASLATGAKVLANESISGCSGWSSAVGQEIVAVNGALLCAGFTVTRMALRDATNIDPDTINQLCTLSSDIILATHDKSLKHAAYAVIGQLCLCVPSEDLDLAQVLKLVDTMISDAKKEDETAVTVLGRVLGLTYSREPEKSTSDLLERLYSLHEIRKAELHFALGEALATGALGFKSESTIAEFDVDGTKPERGFHPDLLNRILDRSINDSKQTKPSLKKASAIWLLSIIQYCNETTMLKPRLRDCQGAFAKLLNDRDDIVQETGSRGLSLVYEKGDKALRDDLVRDLVQSFTGTAKMSGTVSEDTQLFEAGALPTEGGQSVQTYKDIVSLATEMGDPSLVYRFMNLASSNAIWTSRAAFGRFGLSGVLADSTYLTENKKFYPKLFRYRFDPNPNVQRSMEDIWKALVKDSNKVIEDNFDLIMTDLLKSVLSGKDWRAREASCAAISDLIQGREVEKFETYLEEIWNVAFKVLDDVKETVRVAAMKLCRTLTGMLIRNLEVGEGTSKRAATMMHHALPFLLQQMENGSAQEVQQYAVVTLLDVVKKSPPRSLQDFAPKILERLVLSLSSLEHESINYLHLNADKYGLTAEKLDKMRVSSINASPVSEAIERCLDSIFAVTVTKASTDGPANSGDDSVGTIVENIAPTTDAVQKLEAVFKQAIGLPSKVGLSRVMITLVVRHHAAFCPYADRFLQLTRKYVLDRNATISISFSMAVGYLVRLASQKEVNETSRYAQQLYFQSQELAHRAVAGEIIQAISKASNDVLMNFASTFLPFAFIGRNDLDSDVRNRFEPSWQDNIGGSRALNLYLGEIVGLISKHITSSLWPIRQACCLAVANLVSSMEGAEEYSTAEAGLLWHVVEEALNGKTWKGKEKVIEAYPKFVRKAQPIWADKGKRMKIIAVREAKRNNTLYKPHALTALGEVGSAMGDLELKQEVLEVLTNVIEELRDQEDAMDVDMDGEGGDEQGSGARHADAIITATMTCLFQILTQKMRPEDLDRALNLVRQAHGKRSVKIDMEIYDGARRYITQSTRGGPSSSESIGSVGVSQIRVLPGTHQAANTQQGDEEKQEKEHNAAFLHGLILALFDVDECAPRYSSDTEAARKSRVGLAQALAESGMSNQPSRKTLVTTLKLCHEGERSRPLKKDLENIISLIQGQGL